MNKRFITVLQVLFALLDLLMLNLAFLLARIEFPEDEISQRYFRYEQFWMIANGFWLVLALLSKVYARTVITFLDQFIRLTFRSFLLWAILALIYLFLPRLIPLSKNMVFAMVIMFGMGLLLNRFFCFGLRQWIKLKVEQGRKVLILGYNNTAKKFTNYLENEGLGIQIMGYIDDKKITGEAPKYPVYNGIEDTLVTAKRLRVNEVYSTVMPESNNRVYNLLQHAGKELIRFHFVADLSLLISQPVHVDILHELPILSVRKEPLEDIVNKVLKRTFDIFVSSFVTIFILSWLVPILGILIKLESPGPVFFVQLRSGKNNKPFRCYKFRSMGTFKEMEAVQASKNDIRVTRIGRILRKTSLDEFPQFLNVLKGEMSVVGPRPHMLKHTKEYSSMADEYMIRQFLKPGITGWAQVNGYRGEIKELLHIKKRVEYDLWYLEHWSLSLDLRIIFLTVYNIFKGEENAY
jgi:putative colanic acid biosynthesis UDP-glucose lipid carrier transferase